MTEIIDFEKSESALLSELKDLTVKFQNDLVHFTLDYDELVECFHNYMYELVNYSPLNLYNNPLSKFIKGHLGNEIPGCFLDEFKYYEEDSEFKNELNELVRYYMDIIEDGYGISDSEFLELYRLSLIDEENSSLYINYLLSQLIENNNKTSDTVYKDIINRFVKNVIDKNGLDISFRIGKLSKKDDEEDVYADSVCKRGRYFVNFDRNHMDAAKVMFNLEDIFHELWHTVQDSDEYNDQGVITLIKMDDYIRRVFGSSYYDENYNVISYEVDANLHAVMIQANLLKEISPATYDVNKDWLNRRVERYNELLQSRVRKFEGFEYDIDVLFEMALLETRQSREEVLGESQGEKKLLKEISFK